MKVLIALLSLLFAGEALFASSMRTETLSAYKGMSPKELVEKHGKPVKEERVALKDIEKEHGPSSYGRVVDALAGKHQNKETSLLVMHWRKETPEEEWIRMERRVVFFS